MDAVGVGLLGAGTVGAALASLLIEQAEAVEARTGVRLCLRMVAVADTLRPRPAQVPASLVVGDPFAVVRDPRVDVVVELIGGLSPASELVRAALAAGKPVVTANKTLLAAEGPELFAAAELSGVDLLFEAAVGGAIPLVRPLRESLAGERLHRVVGIVNGTTNYVLTAMAERGLSLADAVAEAQALGYAERDPSADLEGHDAAAKAAILAGLAFGVDVRDADVPREGIGELKAADLAWVRARGFEVRLLAVAELRVAPGSVDAVSVRVHPAMVPAAHPLASVRGAHNAVFLEGASVGELMLYGRGAGGAPTAAAVLGDLIDAAHNVRSGAASRVGGRRRVPITPLGELSSAFYLSVDVVDRPGVLAAVATAFGEHGVSIRSMEQAGLGDEARLVFLTHRASEAAMAATMTGLEHLDAVRRVGGLLRVLEDAGREPSA